MASVDQTSTVGASDLLTDWPCIFHQPSEDPEPSSLPSTVDIAAFSSDVNATIETPPILNVPVNVRHEKPVVVESESGSDSDSEEESDSDGSNSCTQSSSESDSSSTSLSSTTSGSVTVRKPVSVSVPKSKSKSPPVAIKTPLKLTLLNSTNKKSASFSASNLSSSDYSDINNNTNNYDSESSDENERYKVKDKNRNKLKIIPKSAAISKQQNRKMLFRKSKAVLPSPPPPTKKSISAATRNSSRQPKKLSAAPVKKLQKMSHRRESNKFKKMPSLTATTEGQTWTQTSHSDESDSEADCGMLESCSLQEIRQEDLAAILPDQQDTAETFGGFGAESKTLTVHNQRHAVETPGDASGSDTEFSSQLVNAAIQRVTTESSSEPEAPESTIYSSSLLQQFVKQTQLLNDGPTSVPSNASSTAHHTVLSSLDDQKTSILSEPFNRKRRGRPKKDNELPIVSKSVGSTDHEINEYCGLSNVSPDSGIQESPEHISSPEFSPDTDRFPTESSQSVIVDDRNNNHNNNNLTNIREKNKMVVDCNNLDKGYYQDEDLQSNRKPKCNLSSSTPLLSSLTVEDEGPDQFDDVKCALYSRKDHRKHIIRLFKVARSKLYDSKLVKPNVDDLTNAFNRCCNIDVKKPLAPIKDKKLHKKRKNPDSCQTDLRKKKKPSNQMNPTDKYGQHKDQYLPLKKRHYYHHDPNSVNAPESKPVTVPKPETLSEPDADSSQSDAVSSQPDSKLKLEATSSKIKSVALKEKDEKEPVSEVKSVSVTKIDATDEDPTTNEKMVLRKKKKQSIVELDDDEDELLAKAKRKSKPKAKPAAKMAVEPVANVGQQMPVEVPKTLRKRRRRKPNRTGFPTPKRRKKIVVEVATEDPEENESSISSQSPSPSTSWIPGTLEPGVNDDLAVENETETVKDAVYDRVPRNDENVDSFVCRTGQCSDSISDDVSDNEELPTNERTESNELDECRYSKSKKTPCLKKFKKDATLPLRSSSRVGKTSDKDLSAKKSTEEDKVLPRPPRKSVQAGLYSDFYKTDSKQMEAKKQELRKQPMLEKYPEPLKDLMRPMHYGKKLIEMEIDFDLENLFETTTYKNNNKRHKTLKLTNTKDIASWKYRKIRSNTYGCRAPTNICDPQPCTCTDGCCGEQCINRVLFAECPASSHKCSNQRIQRHEAAPGLERFMTLSKGWGVRTRSPIKASDYILEYMGEVVSEQEFKKRMTSIYQHDIHHYCLHLDGGLVIDAHRMGSEGRFVNHSCYPNCEMQKWSVNGHFRMVLFALRDIRANEELTYDYNFALFNISEGQICKCDSKNCRGVIGGKSQRLRPNLATPSTSGEAVLPIVLDQKTGRSRKTRAKKSNATIDYKDHPTILNNSTFFSSLTSAQNLSVQLKKFIQDQHCFLIRNLKVIRRLKYNSCKPNNPSKTDDENLTNNQFVQKLNSIRPNRNVSTRCSVQAQSDPEIFKTANLSKLFKQIFDELISAKDEKDAFLCDEFRVLPIKRKNAAYYEKITDPIDLAMIEQNILNGAYRHPEQFNEDVLKLINNAIRFYGRLSDLGICAVRLLKIFTLAKHTNIDQFEQIIGEKLPKTFFGGEQEDVIRCVCGLCREDGVMIQCERCMVWQHCECVSADDKNESYLCEKCSPREVSLEIPIKGDFTDDGHQCYLSLLRGDLQVRESDTVYVLRDITIPGTDKKHTYDTIGDICFNDLDIFRIEKLWIHKDTGEKFAYGHHFLRPHETFHEPTRKFFENEVLRVPIFEAVHLELIIRQCWVVDLNTYCRGRPIGAPVEHIYICDYRVDRSARIFSKIGRLKPAICTKSYAFERFPERMKISRTFTPHEVDPEMIKGQRGRRLETKPFRSHCAYTSGASTLESKKLKLNNIVLKLLNRRPTKHAIDLSYLVDGSRRKKRKIQESQQL